MNNKRKRAVGGGRKSETGPAIVKLLEEHPEGLSSGQITQMLPQFGTHTTVDALKRLRRAKNVKKEGGHKGKYFLLAPIEDDFYTRVLKTLQDHREGLTARQLQTYFPDKTMEQLRRALRELRRRNSLRVKSTGFLNEIRYIWSG